MKKGAVARFTIILGITYVSFTFLTKKLVEMNNMKNGRLFNDFGLSSTPLKSKGSAFFRLGAPTHLSTTNISISRMNQLLCGIEAKV